MKKGQVVEGIVKEIQFPNKGMVEVEGEERKVIVKNVLPGQKVKASVNKIRKGKAEGLLLEVLEKSQEEIGQTAAAVVQEAEEAPEEKPTEQRKTGTENAEKEGIYVEIPQVRLE